MNQPLEANRRQFLGEAPPEAQLLALDPLAPHSAGSAPVLGAAASPLLGVKARLQVCVGETTVTVGELMSAREGHVLALDRRVDEVVDLMLDGRVVARGQLVAVDDVFGIRITELPLPLAP